ncbi:uncharacterized protein [Miscanthus floridulus]|uniref:uncharacterized protein n=1 Tax=Miscanthus floridulus TaxID=154761 RepID=UPI003458C4E0
MAAFHRRRVLPLMAQRRRLFKMRLGEPNEGIRMSSSALSDEEILHQVGEMVEAKLRGGNLTPIVMRPSWGFLSLGMRDMRASPPPIPKDVRRRAVNRVHAEAQKKRKDAKAAKCTKKILTCEELDKRRWQQRKDGLPLEESLSPSLWTEASDGDDNGEMGRGPLDHLPDVGETVPGASASSPALLGGGGADPGSAISRSRAEADMPEAWALGKRVVSPVGSTAAVEQVAAEATQLPPQRTKGALGSIEDQLVPMDIEAMPLPPPPPLQTRVAVAKRLPPRSSRKWPTEVPTLAPLKVLKVNLGSTTHWVAEAQSALQHGTASAKADPKEPATQGGASEVALTQEGEGAPPPCDGEARGSDAAEVPLATETTETEVLGVSRARATKATAPRTIKAAAAELGSEASRVAEAFRVEAQRLKEKAEAFRVEARHWELKAKELEAEVTRAAEASSVV